MSLVRLNIKSRIELETRVLAAALKQSFDRGDTQGASLAHKQLFHLLKDAGKAEPGGVATIRIADGVLPGAADGEARIESEPGPGQSTAPAEPNGSGSVAAVSAAEPESADAATAGVDAEESLAARLYKQPLFGDYKKASLPVDEGNTFDSVPAVETTPSKFRQGFMRNSARLQTPGRSVDIAAATLNDEEVATEPSLAPPNAPVEQMVLASSDVVALSDAQIFEPVNAGETEATQPLSEPEPTVADQASTMPERFIQHATEIVAHHVPPDQIVQTSENEAVVAPDTVPHTLAQQQQQVVAEPATREVPAAAVNTRQSAAPNVVPPEQPQRNAPAQRLQSDFEPPVRTESAPVTEGPGLYGLLAVSQLAAFEDIHRNFLRQAKNILREIKANRAIRYDKLPELQRLWVAHDILTDPVTRTDYDFRELGVRGTAETIAHPAEEQQPARLGSRTPLRIGELLQCAGLLESTELEIACDMHKAMPEIQFGTFLVRQGFIEEHHLEAVLVGQKLLRCGAISVAQFQSAMEASQADSNSISDALVQKGYISTADLALALNPPPPEEPPVIAIQIREVPIPVKTKEMKSADMKPAMPAWKDQLDWGPPEESTTQDSAVQPVEATSASTVPAAPNTVPPQPQPVAKSLGGFLASQQNPGSQKLSGKNAVPSWQDQIDWAAPDEAASVLEGISGLPEPANVDNGANNNDATIVADGANGGGSLEQSRELRAPRPVDTLTSLPAQNAIDHTGELQIVEPTGEPVPEIRLSNAVPTWKDQLDWGSPDDEVIVVSTSENPAIGAPDEEFQFGVESGSSELDDVVSNINLPLSSVPSDPVHISDFNPTTSAEILAFNADDHTALIQGPAPESEAEEAVDTGEFLSAEAEAEPVAEEKYAAFPMEQDSNSNAHSDSALDSSNPYDQEDAASVAKPYDQFGTASGTFAPLEFPPKEVAEVAAELSEIPAEGGFFAHLMDKTEIFEGSAAPLKALELNLHDTVAPEQLAPVERDTGEMPDVSQDIAETLTDGVAVISTGDEEEGEDSEPTSDAAKSSKKEKRRKTKERRKKRR